MYVPLIFLIGSFEKSITKSHIQNLICLHNRCVGLSTCILESFREKSIWLKWVERDIFYTTYRCYNIYVYDDKTNSKENKQNNNISGSYCTCTCTATKYYDFFFKIDLTVLYLTSSHFHLISSTFIIFMSYIVFSFNINENYHSIPLNKNIDPLGLDCV
jgi:hypothetical protein